MSHNMFISWHRIWWISSTWLISFLYDIKYASKMLNQSCHSYSVARREFCKITVVSRTFSFLALFRERIWSMSNWLSTIQIIIWSSWELLHLLKWNTPKYETETTLCWLLFRCWCSANIQKMETHFVKIVSLKGGQTAYYIMALGWFSLLMHLYCLNKCLKWALCIHIWMF